VHAQFVLFFFCLPFVRVALRGDTLYRSDGKFDRSENLPQCTRKTHRNRQQKRQFAGRSQQRPSSALRADLEDSHNARRNYDRYVASPDRGALSAKEDGPMARLILTSLVLAIFIHPLYAQSSLYTDRSGYTTGTQDGRSVNTYTDRYGNTTGWVGGKYQSTYSDGYGGTTGTIGNKRINTYDDGYGNITGTIGRDRINLHTDSSGVTTGTVGQRRLNCYSNRFSTTCY
jgi:hypothetical protein